MRPAWGRLAARGRLPWATPGGGPRPRRARGIALLTVLAVVLLITVFVSEYFFANGLELRAMQTFRDAQQARNLAKSAFKAVQLALMLDELEFNAGYAQLNTLLSVASVPFEDGLLVELKVAPQDALFNLNQLAGLQPGGPEDDARFQLFRKILVGMEVPSPDPAQFSPQPPTEEAIATLYAALVDWIDENVDVYTIFSGVPGAEADAYYLTDPDYVIKNGRLDRLSELRLVQGFAELGIPWAQWQEAFTVRPKEEQNYFYPEKLNVNTATREELLRHLERRAVDPAIAGEWDSTSESIQFGLNDLQENAELIADVIIPPDEPRPAFTEQTLAEALTAVGIDNKYWKQIFDVTNEYYRVHLVVEVSEVTATLDAQLRVPRNTSTRVGREMQVLELRVR